MRDRMSGDATTQRRQQYVRRIVEAVNYRGNNDFEDVLSILEEFEAKNLNIIRRQEGEIKRLRAKKTFAPPCKIGDIVYVEMHGYVEEGEVIGFAFFKEKTKVVISGGLTFVMNEDAFLTRDEAVANALTQGRHIE